MAAAETDPPVENKIIRVRAYLEAKAPKGKGHDRKPLPPSDWALIFDTETRTDPGQHLRIGAYQLRYRGDPIEQGWFYEPATTTAAEIRCIESVAAERATQSDAEVRVITRDEFVERVFYGRAWGHGARIIGFNLPFDISRLAVRLASSARTDMVGGFSFALTENDNYPNVRIKAVSRHLAFIKFASMDRKSSDKSLPLPLPEPGFFIDIKTLSFALLAESHSLSSLSKSLKVATIKEDRDDHGGKLTSDYVRYAAKDVQTTWECYKALEQNLKAYGVELDDYETYSGASLGKAHLEAMNIRPWRAAQKDMPSAMIGRIMSTYSGGRSEVHIRRVPTRTVLCDFLSMYPTVSTLMRTWKFLTATGFDALEDTEAVRALVDGATLDSLGDQQTWPLLAAIAAVLPDKDVFPVRANYGEPGEDAYAIGLNYLSAGEPLWFTLADVIASKLITGRTPKIVQAFRFKRRAKQSGLKQIDILGRQDLHIDPREDNFFKAIVELRQQVKDTPAEKPLKVLVNATGYGIFVELNAEDSAKPQLRFCYAGGDQASEMHTETFEKPGPYFHPLIGTMITGAARLMLTLAERKASENGLDWVFCDTDSLALAKPSEMSEAGFIDRVHETVDWFKKLNPYSFGGSILQIEKVNYKGEKKENGFEPLHCVAISAKRYALYVKGADGLLDLCKGSAHGLGHLVAPYPDKDEGQRRRRLKVGQWQEDVWIEIIRACEAGTPDDFDLSKLPGFEKIAASQYAATRPQLLGWFRGWNESRPFDRQVKPFNFLLALQAKSDFQLSALDAELGAARSRFKDLAPVTPFQKDIAATAIERARPFDRNTGERVPITWLQNLADALEGYHDHAEAKFWGGDRGEWGVLRRRHINAVAVELIGKETDDLEFVEFLQEEQPGLIFGLDMVGLTQLRVIIMRAAGEFGHVRLSNRAKVSHHRVSELGSGASVDWMTIRRLFNAAEALRWEAQLDAAGVATTLNQLNEIIETKGLSRVATDLGIDASNLSKMARGERRMPAKLRRKLLRP